MAPHSTSGAPGTAAHGDPKHELVTHLPALRAFALSLTRESASADDLVQDTIVKAWTNMDKFQPGTNLRAWLFTILRNTFYSGRRKTRREVSDSDGLHAARLATRPEHDGRLALNDFRAAFVQLPDEQREALILVGASGFSYDEAARMTGVAVVGPLPGDLALTSRFVGAVVSASDQPEAAAAVLAGIARLARSCD